MQQRKGTVEDIQERLRKLHGKNLTPQQYTIASARLLDQLRTAKQRKPPYAIT